MKSSGRSLAAASRQRRLVEAARAGHRASLCVIPAAPNGTKAPWPDGPQWKRFQTERPSLDDIDRWFTSGNYPGMGVVCGAISDGLEMVEFEGRAMADGIYNEFMARAKATGLIDLVNRIADGYEEETPTGGIHWFYRCSEVAGNITFARRPAREEEKLANPGEQVVVLMESRGEGGFSVTSPSSGPTHPTGRSWVLRRGGFTTIVTITPDEREDLHALLRSFDRMPDRDSPERGSQSSVVAPDGTRPGDDFIARTTWAELLEPRGWVPVYESNDETYWRRPGKEDGVSATTNYRGMDRLKVFSTSTPFDSETTYDRFSAYAVLEHDGNFVAAARALRRQGYGSQRDSADHSELPVIVVNGRPLRDITGDLVRALVAENDPPVVFVRGGVLTRVRRDEKRQPIIEAMNEAHLRNRLARIIDTVRVNQDGHRTHVPPPMDVIRDVTASPGWADVPALEAITEIPTLRPDGTILVEPGYDSATHLLYIPAPGLQVSTVPEHPSDDDVANSVQLIEELLYDFPFDTNADRANGIASLLTAPVRPAIPGPVPLILVDSPEPGTGKSLFTDVVCITATGRPAAKKPLPDSAEEVRKMITSTLMAANTVNVLDNVDTAIRSGGLAAALTAEVWNDRILGHSQNVNVPNRAMWMATGNNLTVAGDLARRCLRIRLDARQARPYTRTGFRHSDLLGWTLEHRCELVAALLTCARAWWLAGRPMAQVPVMGGFTSWAETIGGILGFVGVEGFLGNMNTLLEELDEEAGDWEAFLHALREHFDDEIFTFAELVNEMERSWASPLAAALPTDLAGATGKASFNKLLGHALKKRAGRHHGDEGLVLMRHPTDRHGVARWSVTPRSRAETVDSRNDANKVTRLRPVRRRYAG